MAKQRWYWPNVKDLDGANTAIEGGIGSALMVAGVTGIVAVIAVVRQQPTMGFDGWALDVTG